MSAISPSARGSVGAISVSTDAAGIVARPLRGPHNPDGRQRRNLTVKLSTDEGATWPVARTIEPGPSGYSDLAVGSDGMIFCFFERGTPGRRDTDPAALTLARFNLAWLTGTNPETPR